MAEQIAFEPERFGSAVLPALASRCRQRGSFAPEPSTIGTLAASYEDGLPFVDCLGDGWVPVSVTASGVPADGRSHHVAFVAKRKKHGRRKIRLYVDGKRPR